MGEANSRIRVAVVGATGYTGLELVRLLLQHPQAELVAVSSRTYKDRGLAEVFPGLRRNTELICESGDLQELCRKAELIFLALPHGEAAGLVSQSILSQASIIDLGADFRLADRQSYKQWYHLEHASPELLGQAVYGICELGRSQIAQARLLANPGCYATCSILALAPLLMAGLIEKDSIIIDAKSGVSGAGRGLSLGSHFNECNETIKAYSVAAHRHTPEIEQELSRHCGQPLTLNFTPHLVPMQRGILVTAYASLRDGADSEAVEAAYEKTYANQEFIRLCGGTPDSALPETRWVKGSNYCDIGFRLDGRTGRIIVVAALDNLLKGAAGQAVQNMNIMNGFAESAGLNYLPVFP